MRYPEEIPKPYRRKGIRQKRTKKGRRHEEKTAGGRKLSPTKSALLPFQDWRTNKTKGLMQIKIGEGVRQAFGMKTIQING